MNNLEQQMQQFEKTMGLLIETGLNWEIKKEQFTHPTGLITDHYGIFRYDHGSDTPTSCLGSVKGRYTELSNFDLADTIVKATASLNIDTNRGGELQGGRKVFLQAQLPDEYVGKSGVKRWVTVLNSHDGSSSISFGSTNTVVICENTFHAAHKEGSKFRHTISSKERIDQAILDFRQTIQADEKLFKTFHIMAEKKPNEHVVKMVIDAMFGKDITKSTAQEISTRRKNQIKQFADAYDIERQLEGDTVWGLFNAVTRYTNHMASTTDRDQFLMTGTGAQINNNSYSAIMAWLEENTMYNDLILN
jgi:phage/plasmid-like protein (TIGR03299 family)